ncbi:PASTA domain-containing protein [Streptomyces sp. 351MFTsu5.1]|uniref:PASTA domain-containing protein n=1 Tax=Streptomyces sp. 351MFTsu5.1 TaxID=1172180 RepID=UPI00038082A3|nr:PASTA domain-containing protein [Streptomyces sp. 351MFTsu5.1]
MRHHTLAAAAVLGIAALTACGPTEKTSSSPTNATTATASSGKTAGETKTVPNFVGKGLQSAQDEAQAAGFYNLDSHDASGRDRNQILDRDWKVCTQTPTAGVKADASAKLDFGTVKLDETCPAKDQSAPAEAGATMPNFAGKSVKAARSSLDSSTSITVKDASGEGRIIVVASNWKVCTQDPKAGAKLNGQPVTFTAVKYEETCP